MTRTLKDIGEFGLIDLLQPILRRHTVGQPLATGDDVAITNAPNADRLAWTMDSMIEGVHFRWYDHPLATAEALGEKLVASNASDLASKGCRPLYALMSLGAPTTALVSRVESFFAGIDKTLDFYGIRLIGGDTVRAPQWTLSLALIGTLEAGVNIAARHRATPGQCLYVTGWPGEAAAGLEILEGRLRMDEPYNSRLVERAVRPRARLEAGINLARCIDDLAMIDVSDGVAKDAAQIAARSATALILERESFPISEALAAARGVDASPADLFLYGGEDYELLFTTATPPERIAELAKRIDIPITRIGRVEAGSGVWLESEGERKKINRAGFEHF